MATYTWTSPAAAACALPFPHSHPRTALPPFHGGGGLRANLPRPAITFGLRGRRRSRHVARPPATHFGTWLPQCPPAATHFGGEMLPPAAVHLDGERPPCCSLMPGHRRAPTPAPRLAVVPLPTPLSRWYTPRSCRAAIPRPRDMRWRGPGLRWQRQQWR